MSSSNKFTHAAQIEPINAVLVIGIAIFSALLTEGKALVFCFIFMFLGISWYMIYRKPEYKSLTKNVEGLQKNIEKLKEG